MTRVQELVTAAKAGIENLTPAEVAAEVDDGEVLLVDVREPAETMNGIIPTAVLAPRGLLEFYADAMAPYHMAAFDPGRRLIVYSAAGSRSALAAVSLQDLGYRDVAHLDGGYRRWLADGWPVLLLTSTDPRRSHSEGTPMRADRAVSRVPLRSAQPTAISSCPSSDK
jgi:rhodanese-related sulfurtransferase